MEIICCWSAHWTSLVKNSYDRLLFPLPPFDSERKWKSNKYPPLTLSLSLNLFGRERSIHLSVFNTRCVVVPFVAQSRPFYVRRSQFARPLYVLSSSHESCTFLHTWVCHMYLWKNFNVYYCLLRRNAIFVS